MEIGVLSDDPISALPTPGQGCQYHNGSTTSAARSQQNFVIKVTNAQGFTTYVWTGDRYLINITLFSICSRVFFLSLRWQQAPDHIKGHEPQYWTPLNFNSDGSIGKIDWIDECTLDV
jgi:hypothetical protein